ncbi:hypothetical protein AMAG_02352 [Allomyces macrogynus ATCC 38327]|uniref:BZIP domain-containing protein n=1 Tax=Allomyces macrogynus (strain ATCC 38327) TaxID=578462 RepID=A0A0L0S1V4_ALLM3|nr:hypothetical protein AMAG_02352 [Allomyces macrogynus ATCC 38327]|eukprot:KNE56552.1 hypothetical protein AMAG_02352 [Allomyces macrogynus ATCC 38327]
MTSPYLGMHGSFMPTQQQQQQQAPPSLFPVAGPSFAQHQQQQQQQAQVQAQQQAQQQAAQQAAQARQQQLQRQQSQQLAQQQAAATQQLQHQQQQQAAALQAQHARQTQQQQQHQQQRSTPNNGPLRVSPAAQYPTPAAAAAPGNNAGTLPASRSSASLGLPRTSPIPLSSTASSTSPSARPSPTGTTWLSGPEPCRSRDPRIGPPARPSAHACSRDPARLRRPPSRHRKLAMGAPDAATLHRPPPAKRARMFEDPLDYDDPESPPDIAMAAPTVDPVAVKRAKNTDAARRSRLKKVKRMEALETRVTELEEENKALTLKLAVGENERANWAAKEAELKARITYLEDKLFSAAAAAAASAASHAAPDGPMSPRGTGGRPN